MRWLHLTDIHMGRPGPTEQNVALGELLRALPAVLERHPVDAVLMTGDLAYSGDAAQYAEFARTVLVPLRAMSECAEAQFIAVPGNHDLFHDDGSLPVAWGNLGSKRQSKFFEESLDGLRTRVMRAAPFANYAAFVDANAIASPDPRCEVSRSFTLTVRSRSVGFIATNTAWFSRITLRPSGDYPAQTSVFGMESSRERRNYIRSYRSPPVSPQRANPRLSIAVHAPSYNAVSGDSARAADTAAVSPPCPRWGRSD